MSALEEELQNHIFYAGLPEPTLQLRFAPPRRWRFDLAFTERMVAVEVDGGTRTGGRHVRGQGYEDDCVKLNQATIMGWRVLRVTADQVRSGQALRWIQEILK